MPAFVPQPVPAEQVARLSRELGIHPVTAQVLVARGIATADAGRRFLRPGPEDLHDPHRFRDMDRAVALLLEAARDEPCLAVYGDYDVDGVAATAVLVCTLEFLGARVLPYIPHRVNDGYGLSSDALRGLRERGCRFVVTVDNGTTRAAEIARAQEEGMRIVVTDHHEPGPELPPCPLVNPKRADSTYPFPGLAGCGVALKLALALVERAGRLKDPAFRALLPDLLALVAVGTIADVVPLVDENRTLVALGLQALAGTRHAGLRALLEIARCSERSVRPVDVGYRIGPRINAAGRLGSAEVALELLLCRDPARARSLAQQLDACNRERQRIERLQADQAFAQAESALAGSEAPALVLCHPGWHPGVIGIVAARVTETFGLPAALITIDGEDARGSARCFGTVRLHEALEACAPLLRTYGGHAKAAGFTLAADRIDAFRDAFCAAVAAQQQAPPGPRRVDAELPIDAITSPLAAEVESLQPFGTGNEEPVFCAFGVRAAGRPRRTGNDARHLLFYAASERTAVRAVAFQQADRESLLAGAVDIAYALRRRAGAEPVEIHVREIVPSAG